MNLYVLSELHPTNTHVGWAVTHGLESTLAETCDITTIYPLENDKLRFFKRYRHRLFKSWFTISEPPVLGEGPNVLLVISMNVNFMLSMLALGPLLKQFDLKVAYILDGFTPTELDREVVAQLDHLFVISAEVADDINNTMPLSASYLPLATDALRLGSNRVERGIDIINYGRTRADLHQHLQKHYNQGEGQRLYFHTTFAGTDVFNPQEHIALMSKLLSKSKISLCFEPSYIPRFLGYSPILLRWFEGWSSGCTIVGKRPFGKGVDQLMDWENSTIELPDDPSQWIPFFEDLLDDENTLLANTQRNYRECLLRHDWRYRLRDMFVTLGLPIPEKLHAEIALVQAKANQPNLTSVSYHSRPYETHQATYPETHHVHTLIQAAQEIPA